MKPGYLALYSYKYKAEKSVNYFCINLKPRRVFRVCVPFTNKELWNLKSASSKLVGPRSRRTQIVELFFSESQRRKISTKCFTVIFCDIKCVSLYDNGNFIYLFGKMSRKCHSERCHFKVTLHSSLLVNGTKTRKTLRGFKLIQK